MNPAASSSRKIRTGLFEIDLDSGQMHKNGRRLPLQEQPFRVLAMLLERPGEVVTRQELQARLWPSDTYVGFDEGLNTAIRKLRTAFGDSAANPRFIETLPRRGYRFIAPLSATSAEISFEGKDAVVGPVPRHKMHSLQKLRIMLHSLRRFAAGRGKRWLLWRRLWFWWWQSPHILSGHIPPRALKNERCWRSYRSRI